MPLAANTMTLILGRIMTERVLVVGEALIDEVYPATGGPSERHPGGSPANVAVGLARLGRPVELFSQWGTDPDGDILDDHFSAARVGVVPGTQTSGRTSRAIARLNAAGAATYDFDIDWDPSTSASLEGYTHVHTGSIAAVMQPGAGTVARIVGALASQATISVDPNARPSLMGDAAAARDVLQPCLAHADVVKASDEDLAFFWPHLTADQWARQCLSDGAALVVITAGADGMDAYCREGRIHQAPYPVAVVDTVGAGDSSMGAIIDALMSLSLCGAARREELRAITVAQLREVMRWAAAVAALTVSRAGAQPPTRAEVADFLRQQQPEGEGS